MVLAKRDMVWAIICLQVLDLENGRGIGKTQKKDAYSRICYRHANTRKSVYSKLLSHIVFDKFDLLGYLLR